jgi:cytochrome b subunit of formate dehydrogenase
MTRMARSPIFKAFLSFLLAAALLSFWAVGRVRGDAEELPADTCKLCHVEGPVRADLFEKSPHGFLGCTACHMGIREGHETKKGKIVTTPCVSCHGDVPGPGPKGVHMEWNPDGTPTTASCLQCHSNLHTKPKQVSCGTCHADAVKSLEGSVHWKPGPGGKPHRVECIDCHRNFHHYQPPDERDSPLSRENVYKVCAPCHNDPNKPAFNPITGDTFVPVQSYLHSVHGQKLGEVPGVATCTDCHGHHNVHRLDDPASRLSREHIIGTCGKCHQGIEIQYSNGMHGRTLAEEQKKLAAMTPGQREEYIRETPLNKRPPVCTSCHTSHSIRPAAHLGEFDEVQKLCSKCHGKEVEDLGQSIHRTVIDPGTGKWREVRCQDCHTDYHENRSIRSLDSVVNKRNLADICGKCHNHPVTVKITNDTFYPVESYRESVHGRGVYLSGLYFSAGCVDCHGSHGIEPLEDPRSRLHHIHVADTCGNENCHVGIYEKLLKGTHGQVLLKEESEFAKLSPEAQKSFKFRGPVCTSCHISHKILRTNEPEFVLEAILQCGHCHPLAMATYKQSYHGKAALLGSGKVATCYDCHGSHVNPRATGPGSKFTSERVLEICRKCHKKATMEMVSFINHLELKKKLTPAELAGLDEVGRQKVLGTKVVRVVRFLMELLLLSVFVFFGVHTVLWFIRGMADRIVHRGTVPLEKKTEYFLRISRYNRVIHVFVVVSFMGLALTGLPIKYPDHPWAVAIIRGLGSVFEGGGAQVARLMHRGFAIVTFGYLFSHLGYLFARFLRGKHAETLARFRACPVDYSVPPEGRRFGWYANWMLWTSPVVVAYIPVNLYLQLRSFLTVPNKGLRLRQTVFGPESVVPRLKDLTDLGAHFKWFFWLGAKPKWDKFTYYEKFDYWAVFWGVAIIGSTGLCMWFKEFFTSTLGLPGWIINVAMEIHSHEALLAAGFIFSIHFFNGHLRPGRFPMDRVIFFGGINRHELEEERPEQYRRLLETGELEAARMARPPAWLRVLGTLFGIAALVVGILIVSWIFKLELGHLFR